MSDVAAEIESDRQTLRDLITALGLRPSPLKTVMAWLGEKAARVKLSDRAVGGSSLSRLLELELLITGVSGKLQLWRALAAVAGADPRLGQFDFIALGQRAEAQRRRLENLHQGVARKMLGGEG